ncbi:hypothetical protein V5799_011808 [Amblyomma americanum]|uniref:Uncharacterized protein n=1 Tax=Amblyomma americanum TaxID=6943 RepID=A0AAQ4EG95_AMBAM
MFLLFYFQLGDVLRAVLQLLGCLLTYVLYLWERFLGDQLGDVGGLLAGLLFPLNAPIRALVEQLGVALQQAVG